jgi:uncharacterized membrane protein
MFVAAALAWPSAPEQLPVHFNLTGQVDRYGGKIEGLLIIPIVTLLVALLFVVLPRIDPNRERYVEFRPALAVLRLGMVVVLAGVYAVVLLSAFGAQVNVGLIVAGLVGALFVLIGAVIGQLRRNWFFGIRTPWTLSSEEAWSVTHRAGRWVFVAMGLAIALAGIVQAPWALYLAMLVCLAGVIGLIGYSYVIWRRTA